MHKIWWVIIKSQVIPRKGIKRTVSKGTQEVKPIKVKNLSFTRIELVTRIKDLVLTKIRVRYVKIKSITVKRRRNEETIKK